MTETTDNLPFHDMQSWGQSQVMGDYIWGQVKAALEVTNRELPLIPRRPDVRVVLDNATGGQLKFLNPGNHTKGVPENIEADEAVMVMPWGDTLEEQFANASALVQEYGLLRTGLTKEFLSVLGDDNTSKYMKEAYGPAPFEGQAKKLVPVQWDGAEAEIVPVKNDFCAYGARAPEPEKVFLNKVAIFVRGTNTSAEQVESVGMCIAVSEDWKTKAETTRPIVPTVAKGFYGSHFDAMAVVTVDPAGNVQEIDLQDGNVIKIAPPIIDMSQRIISGMKPDALDI